MTFGADSWSAINRRYQAEYANDLIVGWYHSHPRMPVFMSGMDLSIQRGFFPCPWHLAVVVNAQDRKIGVFNWSGSEILHTARLYLCAAASWSGRVSLSGCRQPLDYAIAELNNSDT